MPTEMLKAEVVLIFKKGDTNTYENYRPISLLNSSYKILAAIIQKRLAKVIDPYLQKTQYGFRKKKSTAQAIHIIRRTMDTGIRSGTKINVVLLDWEKAFDKIKRDKLIEALERMNVHPKMVKIIQSIYTKPFNARRNVNCLT